MLKHCVIATIFLFSVTISLGEERPVIQTSLGKVRGHYKQSYGGHKYAAFEGIPYAKPPIGDLRFEEPAEVNPWSGIWEATTTHSCIQPVWGPGEPIGNEDCLYLNIYVPEDKLNDEANLDVIIHIHGGAFMLGNADIAGPGFIMDRNLVYVSINYRLNALGFLSTEDDVVSGNMGLKDQVMALQWVQKHIRNFSGNPNSVTIAGLSAGSASVHFHYFSPLSKGLFHRGISQGGTALAPWAIHDAPLKEAKRLATSVGCDNSSTKELVKCLKQRPARRIMQTVYESSSVSFPLAPFAPVVEKQSTGAFLTDHPYKLLESGSITDVPWITGSTTEEGILCLMVPNFQYDELNERWDAVLPNILDYVHTVAEPNKTTVAQTIKSFYLNDKQVTKDNIQPFIKLCGDRYFLISLEKSVRLQAKVAKSPVYSYLYGYLQNATMNPFQFKEYGAAHGVDAGLLYTSKFLGMSYAPDKLSEDDEKIKNHLLDIFTSFAKNGKPILNGINWEPVANSDDFNYLFIGNDEIRMVSKNEIAPAEFWESLPLQEYGDTVFTSKN